jgi:sigma-B regulation protein RsbU (phosphoserine phosphatase)
MPIKKRSGPTFMFAGGESEAATIDPLTRVLLDRLPDAACVLDAAGHLLCMNRAAERMLGFAEDELLDRPLFSELASGRDVASPAAAVPECGLMGKDRFRRKNGDEIPVRFEIDRIPWGDAHLLLLRLASVEPPSLGEEATVYDSEWNLRAILDTIIDGVIVIDEGGIVRLFNPAAEKLFGYRSDEVIGRNVKCLMPSPFREEHDGYLANYRATGIPKIIGIGREVVGQRKDGSVFPMYLSIGELHRGEQRLFVGITHDLSRRKQAENTLLILSRAVEQSPVALMLADPEGRVTYVNEAFTRLTGYSAEDIVGQGSRLFQSGQTPPEKYLRLRRTIRMGEVWTGEVQDRKKTGEFYWALETISPIRDATGKVTRYLAMQQDITEQKRDKEALQESEERFRCVAEMVGEWLWEQDAEGRYTYSSSAVQDILGYRPEEIVGKHYLELLTPEDRRHWQESLPPIERSKEPFHKLINHYRHRDGYEVYTESTGAPLFDERGRVLKWRGMDLDITARKRFEDALRTRDRAIEAASVGIVITDARQKHYPTVYANPALSRITGYSREELLGRSLRILQGPETDEAAKETIRNALRQGESCELTLRNYRKNGIPFWNELLISPVRDRHGEVTHYIGIQNDITERLRAEEERHELEIAKHIQLSLLPKERLHLPRAELAGVCVPAAHVGGDYFDYFHYENNLDLVIADVSGHNVGAALIMAEMRSTLKAETRKIGPAETPQSTAEVLRALNELLYEDLSGAELFITMFYLRYDLNTRELRYANAGHNRVILLRRNEDQCLQLDADGLILGIARDVAFEERALVLEPEDRLLLYTDGITEAQNKAGDFFGITRLCAAFSACRHHPPGVMIEKLQEELRAFSGKQEFQDDITLLAMRVQ